MSRSMTCHCGAPKWVSSRGRVAGYCLKHKQEQETRWRTENPDQWRNITRRASRKSAVKRRYGLSLADVESRLASQNHECAICQRPIRTTSERSTDQAVIDHSHDTDRVRGLLCGACNVGLGHFQDRPEVLRAAADYLEAVV